MNKYVIIVIFVLLSSFVYGNCYDDDNGINYKKKGFCKDDNDNSGTDFCSRDGLAEYFCHDGFCKAQLKQCSQCEDGVCLSVEANDIIEVNRPPEVELFVMTTPGKTEVAFKADVSDLDREMVVFTIDFGDGNKASNKESVVHDYKTNGTFKVTIEARDASGALTTFSKDVLIEPHKMVEISEEKKEEQKSAEKGFFRKIINFFKGLF
jgi:hypothetical protein